jgi:hypothetical protein
MPSTKNQQHMHCYPSQGFDPADIQGFAKLCSGRGIGGRPPTRVLGAVTTPLDQQPTLVPHMYY